ncbi:hypothetical protein HETIRDRAFT_164726 [Heterobasidion irregulare TC 32-1]|uniref:Uncharacterized protein n=1 Tax=Heterobasidion irregulare (strain TC 32-1) TaxID=747525 RepID=W4JQF2_HETIT|nr:uncharacterized protein HETIRDRAFT_164726 [Heterobasidion irregulare TC 32-1]ETW75116.1 hypothetical protein HETIRDRAFT_164726 [Heterobasidion irregulare TC 32-1]
MLPRGVRHFGEAGTPVERAERCGRVCAFANSAVTQKDKVLLVSAILMLIER